MRRYIVVLVAIAVATACCSKKECGGLPCDDLDGVDFRAEMRTFVEEIADEARATRPGFIVIPQNGQELLTMNGEPEGTLAAPYIAAIDGVGREDLLYGYDEDDVATPALDTSYLQAFLDVAEANGIEALVTDYCWTPSKVDDSYSRNAAKEYVSFAANHRELDDIPGYPSEPHGANGDSIASLEQTRNFLYLLDGSRFSSADAMVAAAAATNYDLLIVDAFYDGADPLRAAQVEALRTKPGGGTRLVVAYMSIGEAEDYRYYWRSSWGSDEPNWLGAENPDWPGNYKVAYWDEGWKAVITGDGGYLSRILSAGFDGVYLDIIDAFEYFEDVAE
jgi:cysteinyl-tRNA synthetase